MVSWGISSQTGIRTSVSDGVGGGGGGVGGGVAAVDTTIHNVSGVLDWIQDWGNRQFSQKHQYLHREQNGACLGRNKHWRGLLEVILSGMRIGADHSSTADLLVKLWCPGTVIHTVLETQSFCSGGGDEMRTIVRK